MGDCIITMIAGTMMDKHEVLELRINLFISSERKLRLHSVHMQCAVF